MAASFRIAPLFPALSRGMQRLLGAFLDAGHDHGFRLVTNYLHPYTERMTPHTYRGFADGVLIFMGDPAHQRRYFHEWRMPTVNFSSSAPEPGAPSVWPDNAEIGRVAGEHLLDLGLRSFAWFGSAATHYGRERRRGFVEAVSGPGRSVADFADLEPRLHGLAWEEIRALMAPRLQALPRPCGLAAVDDPRALLVLHMAQEAGLSVPDELAIIGANDDEQLVVFSDPSLSSVALPYAALGRAAADLMRRQLVGEQVGTTPVVVQGAAVVPRASTRAIAIDDGELAQALRYIRTEAQCRPLTAETLAEILPVSRKTLDRRMQEHFGRSVAEEIRRVRAERLRALLRDTDWPCKRIARDMGFASADELSRWCQHHLGASPTALRERAAT